MRLEISGNRLRRLPEQLGGLRYLQYLSLNSNPDLKLTNSLAQLRHLQVLYVDRSALPADPAHLRSLMPNTAVVIFGQEKTKGPPQRPSPSP